MKARIRKAILPAPNIEGFPPSINGAARDRQLVGYQSSRFLLERKAQRIGIHVAGCCNVSKLFMVAI